MTEKARRLPGQSILERLSTRGVARPSIGATAGFYERFGMQDPWMDADLWGPSVEADEGDIFSFLSAAPYYARLRGERQRAWRARRRLLRHMAALSRPLAEHPMQRLFEPSGGAGGAWLQLRRPSWGLEVPSESGMVTLFHESPADEAPEDTEAPRRERPVERALRQAPTRAAVGSAPLARALAEVADLQRGPARRTLRRVLEEVLELPEDQQIVVARRVTRRLRGAGARIVRTMVAEAAETANERPMAVAAGRAARAGAVPKGLRPVLGRSPALQTLAFEEPEEAPSEVPRASRRPARVQAPARAPTAHRRTPVARVAREVRTQQVTGRAGPEIAPRDTAAGAPRRHRRPTEWVASLARGTEPVASSDVRYGLEATARPRRRAPVGVARASARGREVVVRDARGTPLLAPAATRFLTEPLQQRPPEPRGRTTAPAERAFERSLTVRRARSVVAAPTSYVQPWSPEVEPVEEPEPRRRARAAPSAPVRRRARPEDSAARPTVAPPRRGAVGAPAARPAEAAAPPRRPAATVPTVRAVARGARPAPGQVPRRTLLARSPTAYVLAEEPAERARRAPSAAPARRSSVRAAERLAAPESRPAATRKLFPSATAYLAAPAPLDVVVEEPTTDRRFGRSTVRASSRSLTSARSDHRGRALLTSGATDYLGVAQAAEQQGALSRSPVAPRVRRMRGAGIDTGTVLRPAAEESADAQAEPIPPRRSRPASRVAMRLEESTRREAVAPSAPPARAVGPRRAADGRRSLLVRDERGTVRALPPGDAPAARLPSGGAAYAAARAAVQDEAREHTPLRRATAATGRRRSLRAAMPHTVASSDFRWVVPEAAAAEAPEAPPRVRVVGETRTTAAGPVSRDRLREVLARVGAAVRAVERPDDPSLLAPAARRTLRGARVLAEGPEPRRRGPRGVTVAPAGVVLRVILDEEAAAEPAVAHAERRAAVRGAPAERPLRRAFLGAAGLPQQATDRIVRRVGEPAEPRRTAARTVRTADGRFRPSPARRPLATERLEPFGLGEPGLPRGRRLPAVDVGGVVRPGAEAAPGVPSEPGAPRRARPLGRTLDYVGDAAPRRMRTRAPDGTLASSAPEEATEPEEAPPSWAHRAVHGTSVRPQHVQDLAPPPSSAAAPQARRSTGGNLFQALARARRPEEVVRVILERGPSLGRAARELPEPAIRLVDRIVREEGAARARQASAGPEHDLVRTRRSSGQRGQQRMATIQSPRAVPVADAGATRRVMGLASKLLDLIHLAEVERNVREAQRQVRMAPTGSEPAAAPTSDAKGAGGASVDVLKRDVLEAVLRELDELKLRRQEDMSDAWW